MSDGSNQLSENDYVQIGYLIRCGFKKRANISQDREYQLCFENYQSNEAFRNAFNRIVEGMGLSVVVVPNIGILFGVQDSETPFTPSLQDLKGSKHQEHRALIAACMIGTLDHFFKDGEDEGPRREASFHDLVFRAEEIIRRKREEAGDSDDQEQFWEKIEEASQLGYTRKSRKYKQGSLRWAMQEALEYFQQNGFLSYRETTDNEVLYSPKRRLKEYVSKYGLQALQETLNL